MPAKIQPWGGKILQSAKMRKHSLVSSSQENCVHVPYIYFLFQFHGKQSLSFVKLVNVQLVDVP